MIRHIFPCVLLLLMITMITGCTSDSVDTPLYEGQPLEIGIIGDAPAIRERNISFTDISANIKDAYSRIFATIASLSQ
ncbi:hypothetical protein JI735_03115 [Paenibacillus sonchi]|uniref:Uncharacterized protein n=1 Tax=Paenibacillus sonchi TaxID=373687 RepID=A0A974SDD3_9BACL|nr:hypothetical protein [Paenibacillus sonchi]MCE3203001.1 hypothetical protein [Paenibacillus sonchi]QQZ61752.1 hypothetical protein JI735_03115 [Paenibacillus sonchi]